MTGPLIFMFYGLVHIVFLFMAIRLYREQNRLYLLFMVGVILGLAYDNFIIGTGRFIGEGSLLRTLNLPRYLFHAFLTPTMMIVGLHLARNAGVKWAWEKRGTAIFVVLTVLMIAVGVYADVIDLAMEAAFDDGTVRYKNGNAVGPPIPAIVTVILLITAGVGIFRKHRYIWLMVGSIIMFVLSAAGSSLGLLTNIGEVALVAGMVATAQRFVAVDSEDSAERVGDLSTA